MIPPIFVQALPFLSAATVSSATSLFVSHKQREQNYRLALFNAQVRREELEVGRRQRLEEIGVKYALDRELGAEAQARRERWEIVARTYPFLLGPGELAAAVDEVYPDYQARPVPIVIIERVAGDGIGMWSNLHTEAWVGLAGLQRKRLLHAVTVERPVIWPNSQLREFDIGGRPAIVVTPTVGADRLFLCVGGCNLTPDGVSRVVPTIPMLTIEFRRSAELQNFEFQRTNHPDLGEQILVPLPRQNKGEFNIYEPDRDYVRLAASAIGLLVARLVDHYHLAHRYGYVPEFDDMVRQYDVRSREAPASVLTGHVDAPPVPEAAVADIPYYRLRRALAGMKSMRPPEKVAELARCLSGYGGTDYPADVTSVVRLLRANPPSRHEEGAALRETVPLLSEIPSGTAGRDQLLETVSKTESELQDAEVKLSRRNGPELTGWGSAPHRDSASKPH